MEEDGGESYGEDEDNEEMLGVNDVTSQLAAAGWQHGVHLFLFFYFIFIILYASVAEVVVIVQS